MNPVNSVNGPADSTQRTEPTPVGLTLRPEEPQARRLSKRMGILVMIGGCLLLCALGYGVMSRQQEAGKFGQRASYDPDTRVLSAREAAKQFSNPTGMAEEVSGDPDKLEPPPLKLIPRRDPRLGAQSTGATMSAAGTPPHPLQAQMAANRSTARVYDARRGPQYSASAGTDYRNGSGGQPGGWEPPAAWSGSASAASSLQDPASIASARAMDRHREAMDSGTGIGGGGGAAGIRMPTAQSDMSEVAALVNAVGGGGSARSFSGGAMPGSGMMGGGGNTISGASIAPRPPRSFDEDDTQSAKREFLANARKGSENNYVQSTRVRPLSPYEVKAGWDIPAVLEQQIVSDLPGEIRALVRENVYDTASGQYLLIPQGSRLVGEYDSKVAYAQSSLLVVWNRIIFPDGSSIDLEGMNSQDVRGAAGLRGKVNNHYMRIFGTAALSSAFSIAAVIAQTRRQQGVFNFPSTTDIAASAAASEIARLGSSVTRRNLSIQPTITIRTGTRFAVRVHKDLLFEAPYRPYAQRGATAAVDQD
jgi:type IV secretory pathway VirB10-like protein